MPCVRYKLERTWRPDLSCIKFVEFWAIRREHAVLNFNLFLENSF